MESGVKAAPVKRRKGDGWKAKLRDVLILSIPPLLKIGLDWLRDRSQRPK